MMGDRGLRDVEQSSDIRAVLLPCHRQLLQYCAALRVSQSLADTIKVLGRELHQRTTGFNETINISICIYPLSDASLNQERSDRKYRYASICLYPVRPSLLA